MPDPIGRNPAPVAKSAPAAAEPGSLFGYMKNSVQIKGDVVSPISRARLHVNRVNAMMP
jgi:hypothetical protein